MYFLVRFKVLTKSNIAQQSWLMWNYLTTKLIDFFIYFNFIFLSSHPWNVHHKQMQFP